MNEAIATLEDYGLVRDEDSLRIAEFDRKKVLRLYEKLYSLIFENQQETEETDSDAIDPFTFLASASLRGESACSAYFCRLQKLDFLGRYAALYANSVTLPLRLPNPAHIKGSAEAKWLLSQSALTLLRLRPLIDRRLISPVVMRSTHCVHTIKWARKMIGLVHAVADDAAKEQRKKFRVTFQAPEKAPTGLPSLYFEGPEDFLEHGFLVQLFEEDKRWRPKSWRLNRHGMTEVKGPVKVALLPEIFSRIADDTTFYIAYGRSHNARYLTDRPGETFLLNWITGDEELAASSVALNAYLTHSVPLLGDISIATLLRIRQDVRDSFVRYRSAIQRILEDVSKKKKRIGKREVQELYKERIEPELLRMTSELYQERRRQVRRIVGGIGTLAASVALGTFGGIIPALAKTALVATGAGVGLQTLGEAARSVCSHGATMKEKNDFYFLLRLTQEARSD